MKDDRTHLAYKAEHAVDLAGGAIVATTVTFADKSDPRSAPVTLSLAQANRVLAGSERGNDRACSRRILRAAFSPKDPRRQFERILNIEAAKRKSPKW